MFSRKSGIYDGIEMCHLYSKCRKKKALVTGSCGLIGSEVCIYFSRAGYEILGVDNNQRAVFFGPEGDTSWSLTATSERDPGYEHFNRDIRDREGIVQLSGSRPVQT